MAKKVLIIVSSILIIISVLCACGSLTDYSSDNTTSGGETQEIKIPCPSLTPLVLYEDDALTVIINGLEYNRAFKTYVVKASIENHSDYTISYSTNWIDVNGYTISTLVYGDVYSGKTADADFGFPVDELLLAGINSIQEISFELDCYYDDTNEVICKLTPTLQTSDYGSYTETYDFEGVEVYNTEKYKIRIKPNNTPTLNHPIIIYVENNTDTPMIVNYDNIAINEQMVMTFLSGPYVLPHSHRIEIINMVYFDHTPDISNLFSFASAFSILPYRADGSFSTADEIEVPAISIALS